MIQMRIVYLGIACSLSVAIGAGARCTTQGRVRSRPRMRAAAPPISANQTFVVPTPSVRTVSWYQAHPDQIKVKLAACNDSPGTAMHDPECYNVASAKENSDIDHFIESAPTDAQPGVPSRK